MKRVSAIMKAHLTRSAFYLLLLLGVCLIPFALGQRNPTERSAAAPGGRLTGDGWATGGGISGAFPVPAWQTVSMPATLNATGQPGRGLPDVAGNADLTSGYIVLVDGQYVPTGGTSAVAPLYAALTALLNQALQHPVGELLPKLYAIPNETLASVFRDITDGDNSVPQSQYGPQTAGYSAGPGWDSCTGLGSIHGQGLLNHLRAAVGVLSAVS